MKKQCYILFILFYFGQVESIQSQVSINEFSAMNTGAIYDFEGDLPDWVEIYNGPSGAYDLTGHYLSDDFTDPYKWQFPSIVLQANSRILIFASSKNTIENFPHTNFKLSSNGEEIIFSHANGSTIDSIDFGVTEPNFSLGKSSDGSDEWHCFSISTPNTSNILSTGMPSCYIEGTNFSLEGGFYDNSIQLNITATSGDSIFYTTDGSKPTTASFYYTTNGIDIDTTTVIRAIVYHSPTGYFSQSENHTYLINEELEDIPVISICTDPCNLWSDEKGIYINGPNADTLYPFWGANFWQGWEVPIGLEFFDDNHSLAFKGRYDMKVHGGKGARTKAMKPLRILAKNKYGEPYINHQLFHNKPASQFKRFVLRNSGSDFNQTYFRDGIAHDMVLNEGLDMDVSGYRPCIVFLNGQYWGLQNIREKIDEYYLQSNHDIDINNVDLLEENDLIITGDFDIFNQHEEFILEHDLSIKENFETAAAWFDLESMSDYFITQTFHNNYDWPNNNLKFWRERTDDGKWRYIMFDLDFGLNPRFVNEVNIELLFFTLDQYKDNNRHVRILLKFLKNDEFRRYFINRYADLVNTIFSTEYYLAHLETTKNRIESYIPRHFEKWGAPVEVWEGQIDSLILPFIERRPDVIREDIRNTFGLEGLVDLRFEVYPSGAGEIAINTIESSDLEFPWNGIYFQELDIDISAFANDNYIFLNWINGNGNILSNLKELRIAFEKDETIIANFKEKSSITNLEIIPNPTKEFITVNADLQIDGEVRISIYNTLGQAILSRNYGIYNSGIQTFPITLPEMTEGVYFLKLQQGKYKEVERFVVKG